MPFPPPVPPNSRTNATPQVDNHPGDHNQIADALTEIINELSRVSTNLQPVGSMTMWGGDTLPGDYLWCRGQAESRTAYPELFAVIGTKFGAGNGTTTFNMPDFRATSPVGFNSGGTTPAPPAPFFTNGVGERAGHGELTMPAHTHGVNIWSGYDDVYHQHYVSITSSGQSVNHYHSPNGGGADYLTGGGSPAAGYLQKGGTAQPYSGQPSTNWANTDHTHGVSGWTGNQSTGHRHAINGTSDTAPAHGAINYQPSLSVNFVIRAH